MKSDTGHTDRIANVRGRRAQETIIAAATDLFAERGYTGASMGDIAAAAGTTKPALHYHFDSKETLWKACVDAVWGEVNAFYEEHWPRHMAPSRKRMELALAAFVEATLKWPAYVRIPFIEGMSPSWRSEWLVDKYFGPHVESAMQGIREMQDAGLIAPGDPWKIQGMITSAISVFVSQSAAWSRVVGYQVADRERMEEVARMTLDMLFGMNRAD
jgi:AcrR family transcriptional regulator